MKIVVIGGTGLIGRQVTQKLTLARHDVVSSARSTGVDLTTGVGLDQVLRGADVVVNLTNSPTFDEASVAFFHLSTQNLLEAGARAGVGHHVVLSIVNVDRVPQLHYFRAKALQEDLVRRGPTPYSIVRATQFFEFLDAVLSWTSDEKSVRLPSTRVQPVASADVVDAVVEVALCPPLQGTRDIAGPDVFRLDELGRIALAARRDGREVITDEAAGMFAAVTGDDLLAGPDAASLALSTLLTGAAISPTHYEAWVQEPTLRRSRIPHDSGGSLP